MSCISAILASDAEPAEKLSLVRDAVQAYRHVRTVSSLTQKQVADAIGIPTSYVSLFERGGRCPKWCQAELEEIYSFLRKANANV